MLFRSLLLAALLSASIAWSQAPIPAGATDPAFTADQQRSFDLANKNLMDGNWSEARRGMLALYKERIDHPELLKIAALASIRMNDPATAVSLLEPLQQTFPADWGSGMLLARAYAESHQNEKRDTQIAHLLSLYKTLPDPDLHKQTGFLLERVPLASGFMDITYSFYPWSPYKIYEMARIYNAAGQQIERLTLESSDLEQSRWAKEHPTEAAAGQRRFSLDGYTEQFSPAGEHTQTHYTFAFLNGNPTYDEVRQRMLDITSGKTKPLSSMSGIHVQ